MSEFINKSFPDLDLKVIFLVVILLLLTGFIYTNIQQNNNLKQRLEVLESFTNIKVYDLEKFEPSRLPLWRSCVNEEQKGEPLAYAQVMVNKEYIIKVPEDKLAYKEESLGLFECKGNLTK